jgi:hypothetical protein
MSLSFPTLPDGLELPRGIPSSSTPLAGGMYRGPRLGPYVTDTLSTMLRLLGEESEEASWLIQARARMAPIEPCDEEW